MTDVTQRHDVAIVGASIAGCAAACFLAREGLRIALIERHAGADAYKRICTHYLQPSATPTLQRLGLAEAIDQAGGVRNSVAVWTRWGWIRSVDSPEHPRPYGYNIRRQVLDPMVRRFALETAGVEYFPGETACGLLEEGGRVAGVELESPAGRKRTIRARLVVGADRRDSRVARLAGLSPTVRPHNRFAYFAHFTDVPLPDRGRSRMWLLEPDVVYMFPNDAGVTVLACMPHKRRLAEFKRDLEGSFARSFATLPDGPELGQARRVSPIMGMLEMPNLSRRAARPGLALVGDAALASDPLWGVGCGWALQSAEWLSDGTVDALRTGDPARVDRALERYARAHRSQLMPHHNVLCDFATGRPYNLIERLFFPASTRDEATARHFDAFGCRLITPAQFLSPPAILRAAWVNLTRRERSTAAPARVRVDGA